MKKYYLITILFVSNIINVSQAENMTVNTLLEEYRSQGAIIADAEKGKLLWENIFPKNNESVGRSCADCHTKNLTNSGKHITTNKQIKPMSPLVNPQRLTSVKKVKKWFKRNCKWTIGRECTVQEKSNLLVYIDNKVKF